MSLINDPHRGFTPGTGKISAATLAFDPEVLRYRNPRFTQESATSVVTAIQPLADDDLIKAITIGANSTYGELLVQPANLAYPIKVSVEHPFVGDVRGPVKLINTITGAATLAGSDGIQNDLLELDFWKRIPLQMPSRRAPLRYCKDLSYAAGAVTHSATCMVNGRRRLRVTVNNASDAAITTSYIWTEAFLYPDLSVNGFAYTEATTDATAAASVLMRSFMEDAGAFKNTRGDYLTVSITQAGGGAGTHTISVMIEGWDD